MASGMVDNELLLNSLLLLRSLLKTWSLLLFGCETEGGFSHTLL